jgi:hypothetical protein
MSKRKIATYSFNPGRGLLSNVSPSAYYLIKENKTFIEEEAIDYINYRIGLDTSYDDTPNASALLAANTNFIVEETTAWIQDQIENRSLAFTPSGASYDPGSGQLVLTIGVHALTVGSYITIVEGGITFTCEKDGNATLHPYPRASNVPNRTGKDPFWNKPIEITNTTVNTITVNIGISSDLSIHAFDSALTNAVQTPFYNYVYDEEFWIEDLTSFVSAVKYDLRYGGTFKTNTHIRNYWDDETSLLSGTRVAEQAVYNEIVDLLNNYVLANTAKSPVLQTDTVQAILANPANGSIDDYTPTGATYNPATGQLVLTIGANTISVGDYIGITTGGITFRCAQDNYATLHAYPRATGAPNSYGTDPFNNAPIRITARTSTTITVNVGISSNTTTHVFYSALPNAIHTINPTTRVTDFITSLTNVIQLGLEVLRKDTYGYTFAEFEYNSAKCVRDIKYVLDAYLFDLRYTGNKQTYETVSKYWNGNVPQVDGSRYPEVETHRFVETLINNYVIENTEFTTRQDPIRATQTINVAYTSEVTAAARITELRQLLESVVLGGLLALPTKVNGLGTIRFQGRYNEEDILLITNVSSGEIIYSFNDPNKIAEVEFLKDTDNLDEVEFASFTQTADTITNVKLFYDTSSQSSTDRLQIFVEEKEIRTRPYDFGTDAIERMRVANSQSMLDADFEYGLQPTKWQAIGMQRGYPSIYEIPGTELEVVSVVTDASVTTQGIGASIITVTTTAAHLLEAGYAITIKGLGGTALGIGRAEGSFVVSSVPTPTTFTFFSKSKVGTANGELLSTYYTQLRKADFYTGASVGSPDFTISSNGSAGTFSTALSHPTGSDTITLVGDVPEIGAPLVDATGAIPQGSQVTGTVGDGSGILITAGTSEDIPAGVSEFDVVDPSGIIVGMAIDRGDTGASIVTQVLGNTVTLDRPFVVARSGSNVTYEDVTGTLLTGDTGSNATFNIIRSAGLYSTAISNGGTAYEIDDVLEIPGILVGGLVPENNVIIRVTGVNGTGTITAITASGTAAPADGSFTNINGTLNSGNGIGARFDIEKLNNAYTATTSTLNVDASLVTSTSSGFGALFDVSVSNGIYSVIVVNGGQDYSAGDQILIDGSALSGLSGTNDLIVTISSVDISGAITNITSSGVAASEQATYNLFTPVYTGTGTDAQFLIQQSGTTYNVILTNAGSGYQTAETFIVYGTELGGASPTNDCTVTINSVDGVTGEILNISASGTALDSYILPSKTGNNLSGSGAIINVTAPTGTYQAAIVSGGIYYTAGTEIIIPGPTLFGLILVNDATITINTVDSNGSITGLSITGTAPDFKGTGYSLDDIIIINGEDLAGISPTNNATLTVTGVGLNGTITSLSATGSATDGVAAYNNPIYATAGNGLDAAVSVIRTGTSYQVNITNGGNSWVTGDTLNIIGTELGGTTPANDLIITVSDTNLGSISSVTVSGNARNYQLTTQIIGTNFVGSGATFNISNTSTVYSLDSIGSVGQNYKIGDEITILGNVLGGTSPTNDLVITVDSIAANGTIVTVSLSGTGGNGSGTYTSLSSSYAALYGSSATFDVARSQTTYNALVVNSGTGYYAGNRIRIPGGLVGGTNLTNDVLITIEEVDSVGAIVIATTSGTVTSSSSLQFYGTVTMTEPLSKSLPSFTSIDFESLATIKIEFDNEHGIVPGASLMVTISSDDGINNHNLAVGSIIATSIPTTKTLTYQARTAGTIDISTDSISGNVYLRPDSFFVHRPYDGGVQLGTGGPQHGAQAIRQSKNYIRYQSGKGIMYTTGALFAPSYDILSASATGTGVGATITIEIDDADHGLQVGGGIRVLGIETPGYDGNYFVSDVVNERKFKVVATTQLGAKFPVLGDAAQISVRTWHGATVRAGAYDEQNGIFWEYDGSNLSVVQRSATFQVAGLVNIPSDSNEMIGVNTRFKDQLKAGDRVVIKGMTHVVSHITAQDRMTVTPDYRGVRDAVNAKIVVIKDKRVKQSDFNLDRLDGSGQSGYDVDISKMQMIGIQYSWYGAGFIDYMVRGSNGNFVFCHRMRNSNVNTEAFMRSGNLPVRYEVINEAASNGKLAENIDATQTTISLEDASFFPASGATLYIDNELITYTGKRGNTLTGCTRGTTLINFQAGAQRTYRAGSAISHSRRTGVIILSNTITPIISHWGSAFITDGGFDSDRGYIFSYAATGIEISTSRNTAFLIRLAPSVSNAIIGDLGDRELLNRAQLLLNGIEVTTDALGVSDTGGIIVEGILNPQNYPVNPSAVTWSALSGLSEGGQPSFAQVANGAGIDWGGAAPPPVTVTSLPSTPIVYTTQIGAVYNSGYNYFYIQGTSHSIALGTIVQATRAGDGRAIFRDNTKVTSIVTNQLYYNATTGSSSVGTQIFIDQRTESNGGGALGFGRNVTFTYEPPSGRTLEVAVATASFNNSGATIGSQIDDTDINFPASTIVSSVNTLVHNSISITVLRFNQSAQSFTPSDEIVFDLAQAKYAQPGETIFKFIAVPGERSELDLNPIKELTNTVLGGRGTYPNGPDVLAINIRKTTGEPINGNVILKWGEAQA